MDLSSKLFRHMAKYTWQFSYIIADSDDGCQLIEAEMTQNGMLDELLEEASQMEFEQTQLLAKLSETSSDKDSEGFLDEISSVGSSPSNQSSWAQSMANQCENVADFSSKQEGQSSYQSKNLRKTKKIKQQNKKPYPTKNFLPVFRPFLINYIKERCPSASKYQIIIDMTKKKCVNCQDFEKLFKQQQFRPILGQYFRQKKIYRDLMQSRVKYHLKLVYFERIHVFEKAFHLRRFKKIN